MVIGRGLIASVFSPYQEQDRFVIFASGVSDSKTTRSEEFDREFNLLKEAITANPGKTFVYFSTCSVYDPDLKENAYIKHKLRLEEYIQGHAGSYHIFRVSNIVGHTGNPATVVNFFYHHIREGRSFNLWVDSVRNLIDIDDVFRVVDHILQQGLFKNQVVNIANADDYRVKDIVAALESATGLKAHYTTFQKGMPFRIDITQILPLLEELGVGFGEGYLLHVITKHYTVKAILPDQFTT